MVESLQVFSEKKIKTIGIEINKKAKFRSWKTLKDCGKGPGKSWNFKILKKGTNPSWESMYSQTSPCGHLFNKDTSLLWTIPYFPPKFSHTFLKKTSV